MPALENALSGNGPGDGIDPVPRGEKGLPPFPVHTKRQDPFHPRRI